MPLGVLSTPTEILAVAIQPKGGEDFGKLLGTAGNHLMLGNMRANKLLKKLLGFFFAFFCIKGKLRFPFLCEHISLFVPAAKIPQANLDLRCFDPWIDGRLVLEDAMVLNIKGNEIARKLSEGLHRLLINELLDVHVEKSRNLSLLVFHFLGCCLCFGSHLWNFLLLFKTLLFPLFSFHLLLLAVQVALQVRRALVDAPDQQLDLLNTFLPHLQCVL